MEKALTESGARSMSDYVRARIFQARDKPTMMEIHECLLGLEHRAEMMVKQLEKVTEK
jgi:hypothetical protein